MRRHGRTPPPHLFVATCHRVWPRARQDRDDDPSSITRPAAADQSTRYRPNYHVIFFYKRHFNVIPATRYSRLWSSVHVCAPMRRSLFFRVLADDKKKRFLKSRLSISTARSDEIYVSAETKHARVKELLDSDDCIQFPQRRSEFEFSPVVFETDVKKSSYPHKNVTFIYKILWGEVMIQ